MTMINKDVRAHLSDISTGISTLNMVINNAKFVKLIVTELYLRVDILESSLEGAKFEGFFKAEPVSEIMTALELIESLDRAESRIFAHNILCTSFMKLEDWIKRA